VPKRPEAFRTADEEKKSRACLRFRGQKVAHETQETQQTEVIDPSAAKVLRSIFLLFEVLPRCGYKQEREKGRRFEQASPLFFQNHSSRAMLLGTRPMLIKPNLMSIGRKLISMARVPRSIGRKLRSIKPKLRSIGNRPMLLNFGLMKSARKLRACF